MPHRAGHLQSLIGKLIWALTLLPIKPPWFSLHCQTSLSCVPSDHVITCCSKLNSFTSEQIMSDEEEFFDDDFLFWDEGITDGVVSPRSVHVPDQSF